MSQPTPHRIQALSLALFCKVIDNYGDIGICWRLARQLAHEHGITVTLWVDDLGSFRRICPSVDVSAAEQQIDAVTVRHWRNQDGVFAVADISDIVIEFFGCDIPPAYIAAMARCKPQPVWLNLEGLSAEAWVEGCHRLPSPHPSLALTKYFFFPGFTKQTGGLLAETTLPQQRLQFQQDHSVATDFLAGLGLSATERSDFKISLFCYPQAPVEALLSAWQHGPQTITCLVPEGVGGTAVATFLDWPEHVATSAGMVARRGALTLRVLPFLPQPDYDKLLWACDFNLVRGEDSFVRAQWAGRPFVWNIYAQDENLHHVKLRAFLQRYDIGSPALSALSLAWNGANPHADWPALWADLHAEMAQIAARTSLWQQRMLANGDLASNLLQFAQTLPQK